MVFSFTWSDWVLISMRDYFKELYIYSCFTKRFYQALLMEQFMELKQKKTASLEKWSEVVPNGTSAIMLYCNCKLEWNRRKIYLFFFSFLFLIVPTYLSIALCVLDRECGFSYLRFRYPYTLL